MIFDARIVLTGRRVIFISPFFVMATISAHAIGFMEHFLKSFPPPPSRQINLENGHHSPLHFYLQKSHRLCIWEKEARAENQIEKRLILFGLEKRIFRPFECLVKPLKIKYEETTKAARAAFSTRVAPKHTVTKKYSKNLDKKKKKKYNIGLSSNRQTGEIKPDCFLCSVQRLQLLSGAVKKKRDAARKPLVRLRIRKPYNGDKKEYRPCRVNSNNSAEMRTTRRRDLSFA